MITVSVNTQKDFSSSSTQVEIITEWYSKLANCILLTELMTLVNIYQL